jgi:hypothetical protein
MPVASMTATRGAALFISLSYLALGQRARSGRAAAKFDRFGGEEGGEKEEGEGGGGREGKARHEDFSWKTRVVLGDACSPKNEREDGKSVLKKKGKNVTKKKRRARLKKLGLSSR